jgi:proliferating cell nuclear antigen
MTVRNLKSKEQTKMFEATFYDGAEKLKKLVDILKDHITEAVLIAKPNHGLTLQSMDNAHVALVDFFMHFDVASDFICNDEYQWGINFDSLSKVFKSSTAQGLCRIRYNPSQPDVLVFLFQKNKSKSSFKFKLCNIDSDEQYGIPSDMSYKCEEILDAHDLQKIIKDLSIFAEEVVLLRYQHKLMFISSGEVTESNIEMEVDGISFTEELTSTYSLKYMSWFCKAATLCKDVTLSFDKDYPLLLHFNDGDELSLKFFLAPKFNEGEDTVTNKMIAQIKEENDLDMLI